MIRQIILITFLTAISVSTLSAKLTQEKSMEEIMKNFGAGINLSLYEHTWENSEKLLKEDYIEKLTDIAKAHFKTVRIPIAFELFLQPNSTNVSTEMLQRLKQIYTLCNQLNLNVIFTYHYGKLKYDNTFTETDKISWVWKQVQRLFTNIGYDNLFFELYNEPTIEAQAWKTIAKDLVNYLRYEDKKRIYIIGGVNYNSIDGLRALGKIQDEKTLYTFHFYEPFIFTHQGADWEADKTYITGLPFPYNEKRMPQLPKKAKGTDVEENYIKYPTEATTNYLEEKIKQLVNWCNQNGMLVLCTETGVINTVDNTYRNNYFKEITSILNRNGVPTMLWDYDQNFSILKSNGKPIKPVKRWIKKT
jgi:endoglucanase